jgi:hypothetical protein
VVVLCHCCACVHCVSDTIIRRFEIPLFSHLYQSFHLETLGLRSIGGNTNDSQDSIVVRSIINSCCQYSLAGKFSCLFLMMEMAGR